MTDIVETLKAVGEDLLVCGMRETANSVANAADEITRLRARVAEMQAEEKKLRADIGTYMQIVMEFDYKSERAEAEAAALRSARDAEVKRLVEALRDARYALYGDGAGSPKIDAILKEYE